MKKLILLGAGGHARVIIEILSKVKGIKIVGITDKSKNGKIDDIPILGTDEILEGIYQQGQADNAFITVGSTGDNSLRKKLFNLTQQIGYKSIVLKHDTAVVAHKIEVGIGSVLMPNIVINPGTVIGLNCIINTGAVIEHDCLIEDHVHISPGAILAGGVQVGNMTHIGLGAHIIEGIRIGSKCLIGAGSVIINDIPDNSVVVGNPGRIIKKKPAK